MQTDLTKSGTLGSTATNSSTTRACDKVIMMMLDELLDDESEAT